MGRIKGNSERGSQKMIRTIKQVAKYVYDTLGPGHEEAIYRDAMSVELQDRGYTVKTEAPISIRYKTKKGKEMIVGGAKIDLYIIKNDKLCRYRAQNCRAYLKRKWEEEKRGYKRVPSITEIFSCT